MFLHDQQSQLLAAFGFLSLQGVTFVVRGAASEEIPDTVVGLGQRKACSAVLCSSPNEELWWSCAHWSSLTGASNVYKPACSFCHFLPKGGQLVPSCSPAQNNLDQSFSRWICHHLDLTSQPSICLLSFWIPQSYEGTVFIDCPLHKMLQNVRIGGEIQHIHYLWWLE